MSTGTIVELFESSPLEHLIVNIQRLAAFADGDEGGNPAGVVLLPELPTDENMQSIAKDVGYSETAFAAPDGDAFRVRYFAPEMEVPFCGHATIALGAALAEKHGNGSFPLDIKSGRISVSGTHSDGKLYATLKSPPTQHVMADESLIRDVLELFAYPKSALSSELDVATISAGAKHVLLPLASRADLAAMSYDQSAGKQLMDAHGLITIMLVHAESNARFHVRNAFAAGGVYEDPATGAAAAAFAGYLRDTERWTGMEIRLIQGEDMGMRSVLNVRPTNETGGSVDVSGIVRRIA